MQSSPYPSKSASLVTDADAFTSFRGILYFFQQLIALKKILDGLTDKTRQPIRISIIL